MSLDLRSIAHRLGGEVSGRQALVPGPNHSPGDRSLAIKLSVASPDGFIVFSHSRDDFQACRNYVREKLGLSPNAWRRPAAPQPARPKSASTTTDADDRRKRIRRAVELWSESKDPNGTVVEKYLRSRGLTLPETDALRFHPRCPWRDEAESRTIFVPAMIGAMRTIDGDTINAVHRTRLTEAGEKVDRRMYGIVAGTAVKIDGDAEVTMGLAIGEGIETCLAARQMGFQPVWAVASAGAIASFPVLSGIESLTLLAENDVTNAAAINTCGRRWDEAGCEVLVVRPRNGSDLNDSMRGET